MPDFWNHIPHSNLISGFLALLTAVIVSYAAIPMIVRIAKQKGLVDKPNGRTSHNGSVPLLGGIALFAGIILGSSLFIPETDQEQFRYMLAALVILFFIGQQDDMIGISWKKKLLAQILAACILVFLGDFRFPTLHGFMGIHEISYWLSGILSVFVYLLVINAFNLIDGIDGLASAIGIMTSFIFGCWLQIIDRYGLAVVAWTLTGALIPFFFFNVFGTKNKLFMGDTGSLMIGLLMAVFTTAVCYKELPADHFMYMRSTPSFAIAILIYPLFDLLRIITIRLIKRKSPFSADRNHIHHLFIDCGYSHRRSTFFIVIFNMLAILWAYLMRYQSILFVGLTLLVACIAGLAVIQQIGKRQRQEKNS
jgi:UDP-N-acetylmuramyl pentapeptide phosphotransferase/UDP-N-acetylglucosamine-1-phosphate transferase